MPKGACVYCKTIFDVFDPVVECAACQAVMKVTGWEPVELELIEPGTRIAKGIGSETFHDLNKYTTGGRRFFAGIIDGIVLSIPISLIDKLVYSSDSPLILIALCLLISNSASYGYSVLMHGYYGQTLGKMVCRIKVLDISERPITMSQAFLRDSVIIGINVISLAISINLLLTGGGVNSLKFVGLQTFLGIASFAWFVAEILTMLTNKKRRAVHDFIARTVVVRTGN